MKYQRWVLPQGPRREYDDSLSPLIGQALAARGLVGADADQFLRYDDGLFADPFLMADMDVAVQRIKTALKKKEKIAIYGDYDVDGVTATSLLYQFLKREGGNLTWYIPRRVEDGYGLNKAGLDALKAEGAQLVVTVDCGITAVDEVEYAKALGLDVIITDHHACKETLPAALAVVNPQRPDCKYPFKGLAGVGVALKLALALGATFIRYADFAALGTVADVMPLVGENRAIVRQGLSEMNLGYPRPGFQALLELAGHSGTVDAVTLGYTLAPRLNAAGRLGVTEVAMELLLAESIPEAAPYAQELCRLNTVRQELEADIYQYCEQMAATGPNRSDPIILLAGENWHQGVVGIVASRLVDRFHKPTFIISLENGMGKGSCRSSGGLSLFKALEGCQDLLEGYGGHAMAAGFTVSQDNIPALHDALCRWVTEHRDQGEENLLEADCLLENGRDLTIRNVEDLEELEPYGTANPKPVFILPKCTLLGCSRVGVEGKHMRFRVQEYNRRFTCIFFSCPKEWNFKVNDRIDIAFTPQVNRYMGQEAVQLVVVDVRATPTRAETDRTLYYKYLEGVRLTPPEAVNLLPSRREFVALWRCIESRAPLITMSATNLSRMVAKSLGGQECYAKTMIGLQVFEERGLIELDLRQEQVSLRLMPPREQKVNLDSSPIIARLKHWADTWEEEG